MFLMKLQKIELLSLQEVTISYFMFFLILGCLVFYSNDLYSGITIDFISLITVLFYNYNAVYQMFIN